MNTTRRREFLQNAGALAAGAAAYAAGPALGAAGANAKVVLGIIGPGGMGMHHVEAFAQSPDAQIAAVCDPDRNRREAAAAAVEKATGKAARAVRDMREVFADPAVDAVVIATPDHWHGPAAILALDAGKHVYVEKPAVHNIREGRLLIEAARRANRVVQVGMQSRSDPTVRRAIELVHGGAIGEVLVAKAWNSQRRRDIGHAQAADPPPELDYDLWVGPAPMTPYRPNLLHSSWRWFRAFGCGDAGNDGVHDIDIARWGLGVTAHPVTVAALGGKYFFDDDQEFPDTQYVVFEYAGTGGHRRQLIYEHRIWSPYVQEGHENGDAFYGTEGMLILGKGNGWQLFGPSNKLIEEARSSLSIAPHHANFLASIRGDEQPNADIETGHLSASLSHLANIGTFAGRTLQFDPDRERIVNDAESDQLVHRAYRAGHWAVPRGAEG